MEFPTLGEQCQQKDCNKIDFLPLQCKCGEVFCRDHFNDHCLSDNCEFATKSKEINLNNVDQIFRCSEKPCKKGNLHEMLCEKCGKHYCLEHRFHPSCPEIDEKTMEAKIEKFEAPKRQFQEANKYLQEKITENIRKALQSSAKVKTASKIHLMRIKQKAIGPKTIPASDRVYFAIKKPINTDPKPTKILQQEEHLMKMDTLTLDPDLKDTTPVFISTKWSLGRAIDSICESCNIKNDNNKMGPVKLRVFRQLDKYCIYPQRMEVEITELIKQEVLNEGDKLIVEYINSEILNGLHENAQLFLS